MTNRWRDGFSPIFAQFFPQFFARNSSHHPGDGANVTAFRDFSSIRAGTAPLQLVLDRRRVDALSLGIAYRSSHALRHPVPCVIPFPPSLLSDGFSAEVTNGEPSGHEIRRARGIASRGDSSRGIAQNSLWSEIILRVFDPSPAKVKGMLKDVTHR